MTGGGDYEREAQIGSGASGTVWRAHRRGPVPQVVALKRLRGGGDTVDVGRLRREATVLTELDHPHVVRVLEVIEDGDGLAVAMQYATGGSLQGLLAERRLLTPGELVAVAAPIADALASAHRRGIVHGDVKPANILFTSDGEPLLSDFGVARTLGQVTSDQITGTAEYMAPELLDGAAPDQRSDVYSLAVVCYEALAGRAPYSGPVPLAVVRAADSGIHAPLAGEPGVPPGLADVVERAMARDPGERFAAADQLAQALRSVVPPQDVRLPGPATVVAPPDDDATRGTRTFGPRPPRPEKTTVQRFRLPATFFVLLALAVVLYLIRGPLRQDDDCPEVQEPVAGPGVQVVSGDPEGDGCATFGTYGLTTLDDGTVTMALAIQVDDRAVSVGVGEEGDQLFLGDWDCDGTDTPGVYKPATGQIDYYDVWPEVTDEVYGPDRTDPAPAGSLAVLEISPDNTDQRCDRISVPEPAPAPPA